VVRCACGLVFVAPQPERAAIERAYDAAYYRAWAHQAARRARIWRQRLARVESLHTPPGRLLDVGCGTGDFLRVARARGWQVRGTELSAYACQEAAAGGLGVVAGEVWEAGFPPDAFDVVTCWHAIEHASDPRRIVQEIQRVLRPGGWLVLATPNLEDRLFRAAYALARRRRVRLFEPDERELHLYHVSADTRGRLVAAAGREVVAVGFDRGAAAVWGKRLVNELAYGWFRLTGLNWGMALELVARKPAAAPASGRGTAA
jgi:SAM-dependent methyltransferase